MVIFEPITVSSVMCHDWSDLAYVSSPVRDHTEERRGFPKEPDKGRMEKMSGTQNSVAIYLFVAISTLIVYIF